MGQGSEGVCTHGGDTRTTARHRKITKGKAGYWNAKGDEGGLDGLAIAHCAYIRGICYLLAEPWLTYFSLQFLFIFSFIHPSTLRAVSMFGFDLLCLSLSLCITSVFSQLVSNSSQLFSSLYLSNSCDYVQPIAELLNLRIYLCVLCVCHHKSAINLPQPSRQPYPVMQSFSYVIIALTQSTQSLPLSSVRA